MHTNLNMLTCGKVYTIYIFKNMLNNCNGPISLTIYSNINTTTYQCMLYNICIHMDIDTIIIFK